ncbi:unnamed protein product, partial [Heterotrigona itama]
LDSNDSPELSSCSSLEFFCIIHGLAKRMVSLRQETTGQTLAIKLFFACKLELDA